MSNIAIKVENLGKSYRISHEKSQGYTTLREALSPHPSTEEFWALKDVSFDIKKGECVGIIDRKFDEIVAFAEVEKFSYKGFSYGRG